MCRFKWSTLCSQRKNLLKLRTIITAHTEMEAVGTVGPHTLPSVRISVETLSARMSSPPWSRTYTVSLWHMEKSFHVLSPTRYMLQKPTSYFISISVARAMEKNVTVMFLFGRTTSVDKHGWLKARKMKPKLYLNFDFFVFFIWSIVSVGIQQRHSLEKHTGQDCTKSGKGRASFSLAYCPHSNGTVEIEWWELLRTARAMLPEFHLPDSSWTQVLPIVQPVLNKTRLLQFW